MLLLGTMSSLPPKDDLELIQHAIRQEPEAVSAVIERLRCVPRMLSACAARLNNPLDQEEQRDLVQEILLSIWNKLGQYGGRARFETWVYRFCFLELRWHLRKRGRLPRLIDDLREPPAPREAQQTPSALDYEHVYQALSKLDEDEAAVVSRKHFEDLSFTEIGEHLGISANTAKTRYYRGLLKLREQLRSHTDDPISEGRR